MNTLTTALRMALDDLSKQDVAALKTARLNALDAGDSDLSDQLEGLILRIRVIIRENARAKSARMHELTKAADLRRRLER